MDTNGVWESVRQRLIVGVSVLLAAGVLLDMYGLPSFSDRRTFAAACQGTPKRDVALSEKQLAQLLAIPEGAEKQRIREIVKEPYCQLPDLQVRVGATAQREAYRLSFDPNTWLIVLYEGDQYTGYRFGKSTI